MFRSRVWRPSLVRAGLLGKIIEHESRFRAEWQDETGLAFTDELATYGAAVKRIARSASGGLRFHDLRHSYATWLVSDGVPVNIVQRLMGHEKASTTVDPHVSRGWDTRIRGSFAGLSFDEEEVGAGRMCMRVAGPGPWPHGPPAYRPETGVPV